MPQFIINAKDHTDEDAINRRIMSRSVHLERMKEEKRKKVFMIGGAMLNKENKMVGSMIILSLPDEESVWQWIQQDVYVTNKVWNEISVSPFRVADV